MRPCAEFLSSELTKLGFRVEVDRVWNVFGEKEFAGGEGSFLLNSHFDTVPPTPRWTKKPLQGSLEGEKLYGLGASDDKASVAATLHTLADLQSCRFGKLEVLFSSYEDSSTILDGETWLGAPYFLAHHKPESKSGVNIEGTVEADRFMISIGCGGRVGFKVTTLGKEAHSSDPRRGRNAIYDMMHVIEALRKVPPASMVLDGHEAYTELNVSKIQGGIAMNIVPGECEILCERRVLPNEEWDEVKRQVDAALADVKDINWKVSFNKPQKSYQIARSHPVVTLANESIEKTLGYLPKFKVSSGRTDSTYFNEAGIKTVIVGPGEVAHIADEYVNVKRVDEFSRVLKRMLTE
jgi:acetylornithine deacetylase/succinyl-diaminopimelate desuccinylase-like protein